MLWYENAYLVVDIINTEANNGNSKHVLNSDKATPPGAGHLDVAYFDFDNDKVDIGNQTHIDEWYSNKQNRTELVTNQFRDITKTSKNR